MSNVAAAERSALLDLMAEVGPDAATLCEGWSTHDLAAHLVARERRPQAVVGIVVPPLGALTAAAERTERARPYADLLEALRGGPPPWSPAGLLRGPLAGSTDVHEFYVHHEDVRRLVDRSPRQADPALDAALWGRTRVLGPALTARVRGAGLVARTPDGRSTRLRRGPADVVLHGTPAELFLWLFGRRDVADVEVTGPAAAREAVLSARLGW